MTFKMLSIALALSFMFCTQAQLRRGSEKAPVSNGMMTQEKAKQLAKCLNKQKKQCDKAKDKMQCLNSSFQQMEKTCQKLMNKAKGSIAQFGLACADMMKVCPIKKGLTEKDMQDYQKCIAKNIDKMPKACKSMLQKLK